MSRPSYLLAAEEVYRVMLACGFERAGDVNFLMEQFSTDWGDAVLYVHWEERILVAYRFGNPLQVLCGRSLKPEFVEKILSIDRKYGANGKWVISHTNKDLLMAVTSYFLNQEKKKGDVDGQSSA